MKTLKQYIGETINESILDDEDVLLDPERDKEIIKSWIEDNYKIGGRLKINNDYTVDCSGNVVVKNSNIESLTNGMFHWGKIGEDFNCYRCKNLKSLEGAPKEVGGYFDCSYCENIRSLEGAPKYVRSNFYCSYCENLKSLEGAPKEVDGNFKCSGCINLTSLKGAPKEVRGDFECDNCKNLTSLEGAPKEVGDCFWCGDCKNLKLTDSDLEKYEIIS